MTKRRLTAAKCEGDIDESIGMTRRSAASFGKKSSEINMPHGGSRPGSGRPRGSRNKRTEALAEEAKKAAAAIEAALEQPFTGDAHALMMTLYKDPAQPIEIRLEAAKAAIRFEKPALATVDMTTKGEHVIHAISGEPMSTEEWEAAYCRPDPNTEH